jgi:hypothetical protein
MNRPSRNIPQGWFTSTPGPENYAYNPEIYAEALRSRFGLISAEALAAVLSVSTDTLKVWRAEGLGPDFTRLGKKAFYRQIDVEKWIEKNLTVPGSVTSQTQEQVREDQALETEGD